MQVVTVDVKQSDMPVIKTFDEKLKEIFDRADQRLAADIAVSRAQFEARMEAFDVDMKVIIDRLSTAHAEMEARNKSFGLIKAPTFREVFAEMVAVFSSPEKSAIAQLRNLDTSLANSARDLTHVMAYRAKAAKDKLFKIESIDNTDAPKSKLTQKLEEKLGCKIAPVGIKEYKVESIEAARTNIALVISGLQGGKKLATAAAEIEAVQQEANAIFEKMKPVYAVNAPKISDVDAKVDAAFERAGNAFTLATKAIIAGFVNAGREFTAAIKSPEKEKPVAAPKPVKILDRQDQLNEWRKTRRS